MTPKEKAIELISKYNIFDSDKAKSKQCALIAVNEIIINGFNPQLPYNFWLKVKLEIHEF